MLNLLAQLSRNRALAVAGLIWLAATVAAPGQTAAFQKGLAAYTASDFAGAAQNFTEDLKHAPSAEGWRNLGNAQWQAGLAGPALLAWQRALWINPSDPNAAASLRFARQSAQLDEWPLRWWETYSLWLPPNTWTWLATACFWLTVALVFVWPVILGWRKSAWTQSLAAVAFGVWLLASAGAFGVHTRTALGVVRSPATPLRQTPTQHAQVLTKLPAGEAARCRLSRGNYYYVRTGSGDSGWLEKSQLALIAGAD
jgi:tetratricopeptide (TPR) repeat protein